MKKIEIRQQRQNDVINFYDVESGCRVATLFDGYNSIIFDELAYGPSLLDDSIPSDFIEKEFTRLNLDVLSARKIDRGEKTWKRK